MSRCSRYLKSRYPEVPPTYWLGGGVLFMCTGPNPEPHHIRLNSRPADARLDWTIWMGASKAVILHRLKGSRAQQASGFTSHHVFVSSRPAQRLTASGPLSLVAGLSVVGHCLWGTDCLIDYLTVSW